MDILSILLSNTDNIICVLAIILILFVVLKHGKKEELLSIVMSLMLQSEKIYGSGTGVGKQKDVLSKIPILFKILYGNNEIKNIINGFAEEYKEMFDNISNSLKK